MIGKEFGYWTPFDLAAPHIDRSGKQKQALWCRCRCGTVRSVTKDTLLNGRSKSCGCYHRQRMHETAYEDLVGQRFNHLFVVEDIGRRGRATLWKCLCDCGNYTEATTADLKRNHKMSCGCYHQDIIKTHGGSKSRLYKIWIGMRRRCYDTNQSGYKEYGGRGIKVCREWDDNFESFRDWSMSHGYTDNLTIDRIDYNGNYCPENCRWITTNEQCRNTRYNRFETIDGVTKTVVDWCDYYNIENRRTVYTRLKRGWDIKRALFEPIHYKSKKEDTT